MVVNMFVDTVFLYVTPWKFAEHMLVPLLVSTQKK